jgi:hypothetical protein
LAVAPHLGSNLPKLQGRWTQAKCGTRIAMNLVFPAVLGLLLAASLLEMIERPFRVEPVTTM